ncbi:CRIB domain-containing protein RIC10 [Prunus dulcis]|uniref:CRIB domain-containing protein RIC10 n=1 Tax=Prunus dulcis TaxID=3755 RepID=A0A4Y1S1K4_PRUDU|nr:CRIB domain-containing protein RIC10 [Prunus dulcis]
MTQLGGKFWIPLQLETFQEQLNWFFIDRANDNKGQEMQIGFPTDVKHVAHIGWEGPSTAAGSPSWMNEFQAPPGYSSGPLSNGETKEDPGVKWIQAGRVVQGVLGLRHMTRRICQGRSPQQTSSGHGDGGIDSPKRERSDKPKQTRRSSKNRDTTDSITRGIRQSMESIHGSESPQTRQTSLRKRGERNPKIPLLGGHQERLNPC